MKEYRALFALLQAGLWEKNTDIEGAFPLTAEEWDMVYDLSRRQTVTALVYRGLDYLPDSFFPSDNLMIKWTAEVDRIERANKRMNKTLAGLCSFMQSHGLQPVLLKGQGVAQMYEQPLLREAGDIDLYFPVPGQRDAAERILRETGIDVEHKPDGSTLYLWDGVEVEHHSEMFDINNPRGKNFLHVLQQRYGFESFLLDASNNVTVSVPSPVLNVLLLNTHILKHVMGQGIGLRQLCDMARAYHCMHKELVGKDMYEIYAATGILKWSRLLHSFLVHELGSDVGELPYEEELASAGKLMNIVLEGGNFGQYRNGGIDKDLPVWKRKLNTSLSFIRNISFSCRYAPRELLFTIGSLIKGQFIS